MPNVDAVVGEATHAADEPSTGSTPAIESSTGSGDLMSMLETNVALSKGAPDKLPSAPAAAVLPGGQLEKPKARDFTGIASDHAKLLEQMSNPAFERYAQLERDIAAGKMIPAAMLADAVSKAQMADHEKGFILSPAFEKAATEVEDLSMVASSLQEAVIAVESNQPFTFKQVDAKGNVTTKGPFDPTPKNKVLMRDAYARKQQQLAAAQAEMSSIEKNHKSNNASRVADITSMNDKLFKAFTGNAGFEANLAGVDAEMPVSIKSNSAYPLIRNLCAHGWLLMQALKAKEVSANTDAAGAGATPSTALAVVGGNVDEVRREGALKRNAELFGLA